MGWPEAFAVVGVAFAVAWMARGVTASDNNVLPKLTPPPMWESRTETKKEKK